LLNSVFELPDKQIGWLIPAVRAAHRLVRKEGIELVITSSPPRTTALIGLALSYLDRIRLVTDLRDPWFVPNFQDPAFMTLSDFASSRSAAGDAIERWLEGKLLERSARVITTTEHHARALREAYPRLPIDRVCTIPNGYDAEDFAQIDDAQPAAKFTLSYLGTFYLRRTPKPLFEALSQLIREGTVSPADLELNLIGDVRSTMDGSVDNLIASYGLADCVRLRGAVSYRESLEWMVQSNLLLLFAPNQRCSIPGKTFEYMAAHRPILCLAQDGATADLINDTATGVVIPPDDVGAIKAAVAKFVDAFRTGRPGTNGADISRYDRKTQSEQFSRLLAEIA
jgi:glycosyltransferase involved in cell wall biosynthesis